MNRRHFLVNSVSLLTLNNIFSYPFSTPVVLYCNMKHFRYNRQDIINRWLIRGYVDFCRIYRRSANGDDFDTYMWELRKYIRYDLKNLRDMAHKFPYATNMILRIEVVNGERMIEIYPNNYNKSGLKRRNVSGEWIAE